MRKQIKFKIMIKASELRIGNFYDHNGFVNEATPNTIEEVWIAERSWVKPIPLTEEWLLKFGFESEHNKKMFLKDKLTVLIKKHDTFNPNGRVYWNSWVIKEFQPKYVHQLQNLYFALTNEELELTK